MSPSIKTEKAEDTSYMFFNVLVLLIHVLDYVNFGKYILDQKKIIGWFFHHVTNRPNSICNN